MSAARSSHSPRRSPARSGWPRPWPTRCRRWPLPAEPLAGSPAAIWPALRGPLGVEDRTASGRGYALTFDDGPHAAGHSGGAGDPRARARAGDVLPRRRAGAAQTPRWPARSSHAGHGIGAALRSPSQPAAPEPAAGARGHRPRARRRSSRHRPRAPAVPPAVRGAQRLRAASRARARLAHAAVESLGAGLGGARDPRLDRRARHRRRGRGRGAAAPRRRRLLRAGLLAAHRAALPRVLATLADAACRRSRREAARPPAGIALDARAADNIGGLSTVAPIEARGAAAGVAVAPTRCRASAGAHALVGRGADDRLAVLGLRRDHQPRAAAPARRARRRPKRAQPRAVAAHRSRACARPLARRATRRSALAVSDYYDNAHFIVTLGLLGWLWWQRADIYRPLRNVLVLVNVIAFVVFWLYPVAPPRMLAGVRRRGRLALTRSAPGTPARSPRPANESRRCPHCTSPGRCGARSSCGRSRGAGGLRALAVAYPFVTGFAVLATGNHFVLDMSAACVTIAASCAIVRALERSRGWPGIRRNGRPGAVKQSAPRAVPTGVIPLMQGS